VYAKIHLNGNIKTRINLILKEKILLLNKKIYESIKNYTYTKGLFESSEENI
jgi:hypothetical protein